MKKRLITIGLIFTMLFILTPMCRLEVGAKSLLPLTNVATVTVKGNITVTGSTVNVRSGAGTQYSKITTTKKGQVYSYSETKTVSGTKWYKITVNKKTGWIIGTYVKASAAPATQAPISSKGNITVTGTTVNVRSGAGTQYSKVTTTKKGQVYSYSETKTVSGTKWYKITVNGKTGWIIGTYVKASAAPATTKNTTTSSKATTTTKITTTTKAPTSSKGNITVTGTTVNVRSGAGTKYGVITTTKKGQVYPYSETKTVSGTKWYKITVNGKTGWIIGTYVKASSAPTTTKTPTSSKGNITVTGTTVNVRSGAGTKYGVITTTKKGQVYPYSETKTVSGTKWYKITVNGKTGWIIGTYVKASAAPATTASTKATTEPASSPSSVSPTLPTSPKNADEVLAAMTVEEKVGQMFIVRADSTAELEKLIANTHAGGAALYAKNFSGKSQSEVKSMTAALQSAGNGKLFLAVDEEGGTVVRMSSNSNLISSKFQSPQNIYKSGGMSAVISDTKTKCEFLKKYGVNMNFAPVADVCTNKNGFMYTRSFGKGAEETAEYISKVVSAMKGSGVASTIKHFPGYGNSEGDTHKGLDYNDKSLEELLNCDLIPFKKGISSGANGIMVTHTIINAIDKNNPASASPAVIKMIRNDLKFDGIIITDGMDMGAISEFYGNGSKACVASVKAGTDLLCTPSDPQGAYDAVLSAVKSGDISMEQIDKSVLRILKLKFELGLYN